MDKRMEPFKMASSARNPRDLKQMVADSSQDMEDMQTNLAKLRNLAADDKSENALLRSRIDEQSELIMILKQRSDELVIKNRTLERINKELEDFRDSAADELDREFKKYNLLEKRFFDLASNHEEIIKIKDDYKHRNESLRRENAKLKEDNARLFSKTIEEKDEAIRELEVRNSIMKEKYTSTELRYREADESLKKLEDKYKNDVKSLQHRINEAEERLKASNAKLAREVEQKQSVSTESVMRIQQLSKEKDELLELAMQRGRLIQETQNENKNLQKKIKEMEKSVRESEAKFERQAEQVNANLQVRKLRTDIEEANQQYDEIVKEFNAFKKHSTQLLQKEKELNSTLRHLIG